MDYQACYIQKKLKDMKSEMSDEDFIIHVLNNLLKEYEVQISKLEDKLSTVQLSIEHVKAELKLKFY